MLQLQVQNVQGKSFNQPSVKSQCSENIQKKQYAVDKTPFDYVNNQGNNTIRYPKSEMYDYMFSITMRGSSTPNITKKDSPLGMSNTSPLTSIYSIQGLHDILAPGVIRQGPGLNDNEVQFQRWGQKRDAIHAQITGQHGSLNDSSEIIARNCVVQSSKEGEQLVFQQFNHIAIDNMMYQIHGPQSVQPASHLSAYYSSQNQPSLQVK